MFIKVVMISNSLILPKLNHIMQVSPIRDRVSKGEGSPDTILFNARQQPSLIVGCCLSSYYH